MSGCAPLWANASVALLEIYHGTCCTHHSVCVFVCVCVCVCVSVCECEQVAGGHQCRRSACVQAITKGRDVPSYRVFMSVSVCERVCVCTTVLRNMVANTTTPTFTSTRECHWSWDSGWCTPTVASLTVAAHIIRKYAKERSSVCINTSGHVLVADEVRHTHTREGLLHAQLCAWWT